MTAAQFLRPIGLACAILGLIQGVAWVAMSLYGGLVYNCVIDVQLLTSQNSEVFGKTVYGLYFRNEDCDNIKIPDLPTKIKPNAMHIWIWFYFSLSFLWLLTSGFMLKILINRETEYLKLTVYIWTSFVIELSIMDFILTILFGLDYNNTQKTDAYLLLAIGVMMTIAARGYILWILNVTLASILLYLVINFDDGENDSESDQLEDRGDVMSFDGKSTKSLGSYHPQHWQPPIDAFAYTKENNKQDNRSGSPIGHNYDNEPHPGWTLRKTHSANYRDDHENRWKDAPQQRNQPKNSKNPPPVQAKNSNNNYTNGKKDPLNIPLPDYSPIMPRINLYNQPPPPPLKPAIKPNTQFSQLKY